MDMNFLGVNAAEIAEPYAVIKANIWMLLCLTFPRMENHIKHPFDH